MKLEDIKNKTNEAVNHLVAALESGQSEVLTQYLNAMARFHDYSFGNMMLIARQNAQATHVAGVRTWNSLGRFVRKGEKGILILAPMIGRKKTDGTAESTADAKDATAQLYGFRAVYVFDISQTEGKELPTLKQRTRYQQGSLTREARKAGPDVWIRPIQGRADQPQSCRWNCRAVPY
jgi:hypothetical protein